MKRFIVVIGLTLFSAGCFAQQKAVVTNSKSVKVANPDFVSIVKHAVSEKYGENLAALNMSNDFFCVEKLWFEKATNGEVAFQQQYAITACYSLRYRKDWSDKKKTGFVEKAKAKILLIVNDKSEWEAVNVDIL